MAGEQEQQIEKIREMSRAEDLFQRRDAANSIKELVVSRPDLVGEDLFSIVFELVRDEKEGVRRAILFALEEIVAIDSKSAEAVFSSIIDLARDNVRDVQNRAIQLLFESVTTIDPKVALEALPLLKELADSYDLYICSGAIRTLGDISTSNPLVSKETLPVLIKHMGEGAEYMRNISVRIFIELGESTPEVLEESLPSVVASIVEGGWEPEKWVFALCTLINNLRLNPSAAAASLPLIIQLAKHDDSSVRIASAQALKLAIKFDPLAGKKEVFETIKALVKDSDASVRKEGGQTFIDIVENTLDAGIFDPDFAKSVLPFLIKLVKDERSALRIVALNVLGKAIKVDPSLIEEILPLVIKSSKDKIAEVRAIGAKALQSVLQADSSFGGEVLSTVINLSDDLDPNVQKNAISALCEILKSGTKFEEISSVLISLSKDPNIFTRRAATKALSEAVRCKPKVAKTFLPIFVSLSEDENALVRSASVLALLEAIKADSSFIKEVLSIALRLTEDVDWSVRAASASTLREIVRIDRQYRKEILRVFLNLLKDQNRRVRKTAYFTLKENKETLAIFKPNKPELEKNFEKYQYAEIKMILEMIPP